MGHTFKAMYLDITGKQHPKVFHGPGAGATFTEGQDGGSDVDGIDTPPVKHEMDEKNEKGMVAAT